ncbi:MAG: hypothetical protein ACRD0N_08210 [Acidimicrobiales bacterium]
MLQSIAAPTPPWVAQRLLVEVLAVLVLLLVSLGPLAVTDASRSPLPSASAVSSMEKAVGRVVRHLAGKAARPVVQVWTQPVQRPTP